MNEEMKVHVIQPYRLPNQMKIKRVCAYVRVSHPCDLANGSYENQVQYYTKLLSKRKDCRFYGVFGDNGVSGGKENRQGFNSMVQACQNGLIDEIYTKSISRFARNTVLFLESVKTLRNLSVEIYFEEERIHSSSHQFDVLMGLYAGLADEERKQVSSNIKWNIRHQYEKGNPLLNPSRIYGYKEGRNGSWVINEKEAKDVRFIFSSYNDGLLPREIAELLNEKHKEALWSFQRVLRMLKNEKYKGDCLMQKTFIDYRGIQVKNRGQLDKFFCSDHHPVIISETLWQQCHKRLQERKPKTYPLCGKLKCGFCGSRLIRVKTHDGYVKWVCKKHLKGSYFCRGVSIPDREVCSLDASKTYVIKEDYNGGKKHFSIIPQQQ